MAKKKRFSVVAEVTISLSAVVYAETEKEALALAEDLDLPHIHDDTIGFARSGESSDSWSTSGELDGTPINIRIDEDR